MRNISVPTNDTMIFAVHGDTVDEGIADCAKLMAYLTSGAQPENTVDDDYDDDYDADDYDDYELDDDDDDDDLENKLTRLDDYCLNQAYTEEEMEIVSEVLRILGIDF